MQAGQQKELQACSCSLPHSQLPSPLSCPRQQPPSTACKTGPHLSLRTAVAAAAAFLPRLPVPVAVP